MYASLLHGFIIPDAVPIWNIQNISTFGASIALVLLSLYLKFDQANVPNITNFNLFSLARIFQSFYFIVYILAAA
jgi:hypothetical protein